MIASFGKACTVFTPKSIAIIGQAAFLVGSIVCTFAPSSGLFICGRALAGLGTGAINPSCLALVSRLFPPAKRSLWLGLVGGCQSVGLSLGPAIGGALIDRFSWRACFGINLPLCCLAIILSLIYITDPHVSPEQGQTKLERVRKLDIPSTLLMLPGIICLLLALQWAGTRYSWSDARLLALLIIAAGFIAIFSTTQYRLGQHAMFPATVARRRSTIAGMWFAACCSGILAITEFYISIYWQGVRGTSPTTAGLLSLGLIVGLSLGCFLSSFGVNYVGYYNRESKLPST